MPRIAPNELLSVGELSRRAGITVATIRYYEERGLIRSTRSVGNHRKFPRHALRRLAVVAAGQVVGLSLHEIANALVSRVVSDLTVRVWDNGPCLLLRRLPCVLVMSRS